MPGKGKFNPLMWRGYPTSRYQVWTSFCPTFNCGSQTSYQTSLSLDCPSNVCSKRINTLSGPTIDTCTHKMETMPQVHCRCFSSCSPKTFDVFFLTLPHYLCRQHALVHRKCSFTQHSDAKSCLNSVRNTTSQAGSAEIQKTDLV